MFTIPPLLGPLSWVQLEEGFVLSRCCPDSAFEKPALFLDQTYSLNFAKAHKFLVFTLILYLQCHSHLGVK